jgi:hypothetical protein
MFGASAIQDICTLPNLPGGSLMKQVTFAALALLVSACAEATSPESRAPGLSPRLALSAAQPEAVLPSAYSGLMGSINNNFPHASFRPMRYQQVLLGSDVTNSAIVGLCLRRDERLYEFSREKTLTIKLGPTTLDYTNLTAQFDANYSAPPTEVFSGVVTIPAITVAGTPVDFDFCIPFTQQYDHPAGANVIVEVLNTTTTSGDAPRDACTSTEPGCTTARAWALSPTATIASNVERQGVIMKFLSPAPPEPVNPESADECRSGGWSRFDFRNQGQCIRFIETGYDSRTAPA